MKKAGNTRPNNKIDRFHSVTIYCPSPPGPRAGLECKASTDRPGQGAASDCLKVATAVLYTAGEASLPCTGDDIGVR